MELIRSLWRDEAGIVQVETAILIGVIALAGIGLWQHFGETATIPSEDTTAFFADEEATPVRTVVQPAQDFVESQ